MSRLRAVTAVFVVAGLIALPAAAHAEGCSPAGQACPSSSAGAAPGGGAGPGAAANRRGPSKQAIDRYFQRHPRPALTAGPATSGLPGAVLHPAASPAAMETDFLSV